ncbi:MAG TPA: hypothetical protein VGQ41_12545 [Pyrinomonadaceae bacterium]|jgi:hypothetical protein|nr:hypothetical protein [Pyrinomonadaceae bacterium]
MTTIVRESLPDLLKEFGFEAQTFSSAEEFLASESITETRCLVLDRHARHERTRSATRANSSRSINTDRLHHGTER